MNIGKVPESVLKRSVLGQLKNSRKEVICGPRLGEDCCVLKYEENDFILLSTDPITGTTKNIGRLAVHITANDIVASGGTLVGILLTILLPENSLEEDLKLIMKDINQVCNELDIQVLGGHTEVTKAVIQPIISVTGVGKAEKSALTLSSSLEVGDDLVVTKWVGLEGTSILAYDKEEELQLTMKQSLIDEAKGYIELISVVPESRIAIKCGVTAMHDITEGGIYGALWEMASSGCVGFEVQIDSIPLKRATIEICEYFSINPYQLISSGSMLIGTKDGAGLVDALSVAGIHSQVIGKVTNKNQRLILGDGIRRNLHPPKSDALYDVI